METLLALKDILLRAIPTFLLVWILYFYITRVFFQPLQKTLQRRHEAAGGLRQAAEAKLTLAERKTKEYQEALRAAWAELYRQQEQERQRALERRAETVRKAREQAQQMVARAHQEIQKEVEAAKLGLAAESEQMARSIAQAILEGAAAASPSGALGGSEVAP
jgi:F-type H+-transporting ATPase subunit b